MKVYRSIGGYLRIVLISAFLLFNIVAMPVSANEKIPPDSGDEKTVFPPVSDEAAPALESDCTDCVDEPLTVGVGETSLSQPVHPDGTIPKPDTATPGGLPAPDKPAPSDTAEPDASTKEAVQPPLDRRWIMKLKQAKMPGKPPEEKPIKWKSEVQEGECKKLIDSLQEAYRQAKFYSIQGDSCSTAGYARRFLQTADMCKNQCPAGLLERNGYNGVLVKNVGTLLELGNKGCLGAPPKQNAPIQAKTPEKNKP